MGKIFAQGLHQRKYIDNKQTHAKMLTIFLVTERMKINHSKIKLHIY